MWSLCMLCGERPTVGAGGMNETEVLSRVSLACSVHSGLLSLLVVPFAAADYGSKCLLHGAFETVVFCELRLPDLVSNTQTTEQGS